MLNYGFGILKISLLKNLTLNIIITILNKRSALLMFNPTVSVQQQPKEIEFIKRKL